MSATAIVLIIAAGVCHATWNLLSKQVAGAGAVPFVWTVAVVSSAINLPTLVIALAITRPEVGLVHVAFLLGSIVLHLGYFLLLQIGYRHGDLSLVYPLARGVGPALASTAGVILFSERPGVLGTLGIILVVGGVFLIGLPSGTRTGATGKAVGFGLASGVLIGAYTVWDKHAVSSVAVPVLLLAYGPTIGPAVLLAPAAARRFDEVRGLWRRYRGHVLATALLSPLSYVLVLFALRVSPVSAVAPLREVSVLFGVILGRRLLAEGDPARRLVAATAIAGGVLAIAAG